MTDMIPGSLLKVLAAAPFVLAPIGHPKSGVVDYAIQVAGVGSNLVIFYVSNVVCWSSWDWLLEALKAMYRKFVLYFLSSALRRTCSCCSLGSVAEGGARAALRCVPELLLLFFREVPRRVGHCFLNRYAPILCSHLYLAR